MDDFAKIRQVGDLLVDSGRLTLEETEKVLGGNWARMYAAGFEPEQGGVA
jgi:microsomal dipeptidase-like Zn-dependent dipeptidase